MSSTGLSSFSGVAILGKERPNPRGQLPLILLNAHVFCPNCPAGKGMMTGVVSLFNRGKHTFPAQGACFCVKMMFASFTPEFDPSIPAASMSGYYFVGDIHMITPLGPVSSVNLAAHNYIDLAGSAFNCITNLDAGSSFNLDVTLFMAGVDPKPSAHFLCYFSKLGRYKKTYENRGSLPMPRGNGSGVAVCGSLTDLVINSVTKQAVFWIDIQSITFLGSQGPSITIPNMLDHPAPASAAIPAPNQAVMSAADDTGFSIDPAILAGFGVGSDPSHHSPPAAPALSYPSPATSVPATPSAFPPQFQPQTPITPSPNPSGSTYPLSLPAPPWFGHPHVPSTPVHSATPAAHSLPTTTLPPSYAAYYGHLAHNHASHAPAYPPGYAVAPAPPLLHQSPESFPPPPPVYTGGYSAGALFPSSPHPMVPVANYPTSYPPWGQPSSLPSNDPFVSSQIPPGLPISLGQTAPGLLPASHALPPSVPSSSINDPLFPPQSPSVILPAEANLPAQPLCPPQPSPVCPQLHQTPPSRPHQIEQTQQTQPPQPRPLQPQPPQQTPQQPPPQPPQQPPQPTQPPPHQPPPPTQPLQLQPPSGAAPLHGGIPLANMSPPYNPLAAEQALATTLAIRASERHDPSVPGLSARSAGKRAAVEPANNGRPAPKSARTS